MSLQWAKQIVQLTFHHQVKVVKRQTNPVVCDPVLREIVGPDPLRSVAAADLSVSAAPEVELLPDMSRSRAVAALWRLSCRMKTIKRLRKLFRSMSPLLLARVIRSAAKTLGIPCACTLQK